MAKLLYVPLGQDALKQLFERAAIERRRPQDQAAVLLEEALGVRTPAEGLERVPAPEPIAAGV